MVDDKVHIEQMINSFDKILFLTNDIDDNLPWEIMSKFDLSERKILILSTKFQNMDMKNIICRRISEEFAAKLNALYKLYEFTDNFILIEKNPKYAMLFNYEQTGILTAEEIWQILLR